MDSKYNLILKRIGLLLVMMLVATLIDWMVHSSSPKFYVPFEYYRNKVLFGAFWGLVGFYVFKRWVKNLNWLAVTVAAVIAIVLQTKYFLEGYDLYFVFLFMGLHFIMFLIPTSIIFKKFPRIFSD